MSYTYIIENQKGKIFKRSKKSLPGSHGLKLNLGCGNSHLLGYTNIDIQEPCDLIHDLTTPLPFKDNSVDEIFSEGNIISLFSREQWIEFKKDIARVLKPGGKLEINFVNFEYVLKAFLNNKDGRRWSWWINTIFGGQQNKYEFSKNAFTYDKLVSDLREEGLDNFRTKKTEEPQDIHLVCYKKNRLV
jgi:predicted SAM-dependent methyltransferase